MLHSNQAFCITRQRFVWSAGGGGATKNIGRPIARIPNYHGKALGSCNKNRSLPETRIDVS